LGPDKSSEDLFKISNVESYGVVWEDKLRELCREKIVKEVVVAQKLGVASNTVQRHAARLGLSYTKDIRHKGKPRDPEQEKRVYDLWKDKALTMRDIAQQLGIPVSAVRKIAKRLGIAFVDSRHRPARLRSEEQSHVQDIHAREEEREMQRLAWLSAIRENPDVGTGALREKIPQVYRWLRYHDLEWLREHCPMRNGGKPILAPRVDWEKEDVQLAEAVNSSAQRLKNASGKPVWITPSSIGKDIGASVRLSLDLKKLPLTARTLTEAVETRELWAVRRIWWTVELYLQEGLCPERSAFIRRAGVRKSAEHLQVEEAINAALAALSGSAV